MISERYQTKAQQMAICKTLQESGEDGVYRKHGLLYVEPTAKTSKEPTIDSLTKKMTAAFRVADSDMPFGFGGVHVCACGAKSEAKDFVLPNGLIINSLCVHYLAFHRDEIPHDQLLKVAQFKEGEVEPSLDELQPPTR